MRKRIKIHTNGPWFKEGQWGFSLIPNIAINYNSPDISFDACWLFWSISIVFIKSMM